MCVRDVSIHFFRWQDIRNRLCIRNQALDTGQVLACDFIIHDMGLFVGIDFLAATPFMNADHGDTNRPRGISDCHLDVCIIREHKFSILPCHASMHHHHRHSDKRFVFAFATDRSIYVRPYST
jgi:hypothetical protein